MLILVQTREIKYVVSWFFVAVQGAIYGKIGVAIKYTAVIFNSKKLFKYWSVLIMMVTTERHFYSLSSTIENLMEIVTKKRNIVI